METNINYASIDGMPLAGVLTIPEAPRAFALMMHGITVDKNEWQGFYQEMARELSDIGVSSLRFDFRGHGESGGSSMDVSVVADILDIKASLREIRKHWKGGVVFVATSFGAGPAILTAHQLQGTVTHLILIAPVIDYEATFLRPTTEWARSSFNEDALQKAYEQGYLLLDNHFKLSARLIEEFRCIQPYRFLDLLDVPILLIHGDKDSMVPFDGSMRHFDRRPGSRFVVLHNADHGYVDYEDESGTSDRSLSNKRRIFLEITGFLSPTFGSRT